ncbi:hypothetical protein AMTR_s00072p00039460 [Amborella trichopoda]|uniref:Uncharacterized protein n=1 Tax=Amborella trichopoda TaxID=13333 RepID=W1NUP0_AMBTC|nr:hypothetical protein AMTR_s00072p00039460 [Amborella trichopoda]
MSGLLRCHKKSSSSSGGVQHNQAAVDSALMVQSGSMRLVGEMLTPLIVNNRYMALTQREKVVAWQMRFGVAERAKHRERERKNLLDRSRQGRPRHVCREESKRN